MDKASGHIGCRELGGLRDDMAEQLRRRVTAIVLIVIMTQRIIDEAGEMFCLSQSRQSLKAADADVAVAQTYENGRTRGRRLIAPVQRFAGFDD